MLMLALLCVGCGSRVESGAPVVRAATTGEPAASAPSPATVPRVQAPRSTAPAPEARPAAPTRSTAAARPAPQRFVEVRYRLERRTTDAATADFEDVVRRTLDDPRGWMRAGFRLVQDPRAAYVVRLGEPAAVHRWCLPYDVNYTYSCQNGPVVALNAERWRTATTRWTGSLAAYKAMLVNHEVGHLLGQHHPPSPQCRTPGRPARIMSQQSTELDGCLPNPWPLPAEVAYAARHEEQIAPPYEDD